MGSSEGWGFSASRIAGTRGFRAGAPRMPCHCLRKRSASLFHSAMVAPTVIGLRLPVALAKFGGDSGKHAFQSFPGRVCTTTGRVTGRGTFLGQQVTFFNPQMRNSYSIRWVFSIQRQLPGKMVLEAAYIGNHAVHLPVSSEQLDYVPLQYLSTSPARDNATIGLLTGAVTNPFRGLLPNTASLDGATVQRQQSLVPFPQYPVGSGASNGVVMQFAGAGSAYFHSLNVRAAETLHARDDVDQQLHLEPVD